MADAKIVTNAAGLKIVLATVRENEQTMIFLAACDFYLFICGYSFSRWRFNGWLKEAKKRFVIDSRIH